jgi:hypothetical protein
MARQSFEQWMREVDRLISAKLGISSGDMRDRLWRDAYEDDLTPKEAVEQELGDLDSDEGLEEAMLDELFG